VEFSLMIWTLPPRKLQGRLPLEVNQSKPEFKRYVICPFAPPCWRDGKPIVGAL
jgi:hypothetical protein